VLLTDPQTSGGLLVSCDAGSVDEVLALFAREGFGDAAVIGRMGLRLRAHAGRGKPHSRRRHHHRADPGAR
jgi:hypothetical protein